MKMKKTMFHGAHPLIFNRAKEMRSNMTHAETVLWDFLRTRPIGFKFRRQHPIGIYIADFYCRRLDLVIEIDGSIHNLDDVKQTDKVRQQQLETFVLTILRFSNEQVLQEKESVINKIEDFLTYYKACRKE